MRSLFRAIWIVIASRVLPPVIIGIFLLVYIVIAFGTDETLVTLMDVTRKSVILGFLLALLPLNSICRIVEEANRFLAGRRAVHATGSLMPGLFDEVVELPVTSSVADLPARLEAVGYKSLLKGSSILAWRGVSIFPARMLFLSGTFCLFAGILVSLTTRTVHRMGVIEGEPLPTAKGGGGLVEKIAMKTGSGLILSRDLVIEVAPSDSGDAGKVFGIYPPSRYRGYFVYPRYLGIAPVIRFSAPGLQEPYDKRSILGIYPAGKEDRLEIPGSPYRILFSMAQSGDGSEPFETGRIVFLFKLMKGEEVVFGGNVPVGGEFVRDGFRLSIPDSKRMVITDFIRDYGVLLVWASGLLFLASGLLWLPVRLLAPRREMLFISGHDTIHACSRVEGKGRRHGGVFHEILDLLDARRSAGQ